MAAWAGPACDLRRSRARPVPKAATAAVVLVAVAGNGCPDDCSGRGHCIRGKCSCTPDWRGVKCNQRAPAKGKTVATQGLDHALATLSANSSTNSSFASGASTVGVTPTAAARHAEDDARVPRPLSQSQVGYRLVAFGLLLIGVGFFAVTAKVLRWSLVPGSSLNAKAKSQK